jgi:hypothetical protein
MGLRIREKGFLNPNKVLRYSVPMSELKSGILVSTRVPSSARDTFSSPSSWRTRSRIPLIPMPKLGEKVLPSFGR